jgi:DNA-binding PadR family transcriptional regulator
MKPPTRQKNMGTVDMYLLKVLSNDNFLSLSEIVSKIQQLNLKKPPSRIALYQRLTILREKKNFVDCEWKEGQKFYKICSKGRQEILEVSKNLAQVS